MKSEIRNLKSEINSNIKIRNKKRAGAFKKGFTLVEVLVGAAVFLTIALAAYNAYIGLFNLINLSQYKIMAVALANEQFEIARNMPYSDVGIVNGIPNGKIPGTQNLIRGGVTFTVDATVRNIDLPFDGQIGSTTNDTSPADNKSVEVTVSCDGCRNMKPFTLTGQVAPKNLETASTNGALFVRVFDANGQPVQGADVHVVNVATTTTIIIDDVTDGNGMLQLIDVPPGSNAYRITVSKSGYSTDRTYPPGGVGNPDPEKKDATVLVQQVTQMSFAIDSLGTLDISSVTPTCTAVPSFDFSLKGSKLLNASGADVLKYSQNLATNGSGLLALPSMEWDTYTVTPTDGSYDLAGLNPLNPVTINPGAAQQLQLIVIPNDPQSLLVTVRDSATQLPVSDATVVLSGGADETQITGKGFINQTDWSDGAGQADFTDVKKYFWDNSFIDVTSSAGQILLSNDGFGAYNPDGVLISSTFDTGSISNFYSLVWSPTDPPASTTAMFQIATATTTSPTSWNFLGPDGTAGTYYSISDSPINAVHNGDRYLRYKVFLHTDKNTVSPNISDVAFTFTSSCTPPGQVMFSGLSSGNYHINITKTGYADFDQDVNVNSDWQEIQAVMAP